MDVVLEQAFRSLHERDGLVVMAHGLGLKRLILKCIQFHSTINNENYQLTLIVNASSDFYAILREGMFSEGFLPSQIPRIITNEAPLPERLGMYASKGCYIITSRILLIDLLGNKLDPRHIAGLIVLNAHDINDISTEAFILRLFRQNNKDGFIKAFSDEPERITREFAGVERLLKSLYLQNLYLYPRFNKDVSAVLNHSQPDLTEIALSFSTPMKAIHSALLVAMNTCLNELKKSCHLINEDVIPLTLEKCMLKSFDFTLRRHLEADWHRLSLQTKQLISDLEPIRKLMDFLLQYDAIDFYRYLLGLKSEMAQQMSLITMSSSNNVSVWWSTHAADVIFTKAKERVYTLRPFPPGPSTPYSEFVQKRLHIHKTLIPTLEIPPKFTAFRQIIDELSTEFHRQPHNDVSLSRETTAEDSTCRRVLVLVKTERSAAQVRELLTHNPRVVMEQRYRVHVSEQCAKLRSQISANLGRPVDTRIEMAADPLQIGLTVDELKRLQEETALMLAEEKYLQDNASNITKTRQLNLPMKVKKHPPVLSGYQPDRSALAELELSLQRPDNTEESFVSSQGSLWDDVKLIEPSTSGLEIIVITHGRAKEFFSLFDTLQPAAVVLFDTDLTLVRELECHQSRISYSLRVFFMQYADSTESHRYAKSVEYEKAVFTQLLRTNTKLVVSLPDDQTELERDRRSEVIYAADPRTLEVVESSNSRKKARTDAARIVVDVRELRSSLPNILHSQGIQLCPVTLAVGDFILSPTICVERKGLSDLFQSFQSGRLYTQMEVMGRYYQHCCLLIEFSGDKAFMLQPAGDIRHEMKPGHICSRMAMLVLAFPSMKILWSRSPHATAGIFRSLKINHDEPDEIEAQRIGQDEAIAVESVDGVSNKRGKHNQDRETALELLLTLPGVNLTNVKGITRQVASIAALCRLDEGQLTALLGPANARKLYVFLHHRVTIGYGVI